MILIIPCQINANMETSLMGSGDKTDPYIISCAEELLLFAEQVNSGTSFKGRYVVQTEDIDLQGINWPTIGMFGTNHYFEGIYDGEGHCINNLTVNVGGNNSFFGQLGGIVMNLGITNGTIYGACIGGIASHTSTDRAVIINCFNKATVEGVRAGGIADNFNGTIANCLTDCSLIVPEDGALGGIVSYDAMSIYNCYSIEKDGRVSKPQSGVSLLPMKQHEFRVSYIQN